MAAKSQPPLPLYEFKYRNTTIPRIIELTILFLLFCLLGYRVKTLSYHGLPGRVALCCESLFTFIWVLVINKKWVQAFLVPYPDRLLKWTNDLPRVDMFITTADPTAEPSIITVNTVLSLLAIDYPADKLACYLSDDGASTLTYFSLVEASKYAKLWVPFCKKYSIPTRAPFRFFSNGIPNSNSPVFKDDWKKMKDEYEKLCKRIEAAEARDPKAYDFTGEFEVFKNIDRRNHPTIIKVIWENKEANPDGVPHIIYISREKNPKHHHRSKAGAMNVLGRVSGMMTNAPFILNVDCDMYANNPTIALQAICFLIGAKDERDSGYVQSPQLFYDALEDDPFGNKMLVLSEFMGRGIATIQGPYYTGTGCFHRRKVIYGLWADGRKSYEKKCGNDLEKAYGRSKKFIKLASQVLSDIHEPASPSSAIEAAKEVAASDYEHGTVWGKEVGWMYDSTLEDILTGLTIHGRGWKSAYSTPDPPAFLGCATADGPEQLHQQKRWATGLLEILLHPKSPLVTIIFGALSFRQFLCYLWVLSFAPRSMFELSYYLLPAFCVFSGKHFLPKVDEPAILIPLSIFATYHLYTLSEYIRAKESFISWWNNQRAARIGALTSWLWGFLTVTLHLSGGSNTAREVTKKETVANIGKFTFDETPLFVPITSIFLVNLFAVISGLLRINQMLESKEGLGELFYSFCVVVYLSAFLRGLFEGGKYGIPASTLLKSGGVALLFVQLCKIPQIFS